jgi:hypothetical protein
MSFVIIHSNLNPLSSPGRIDRPVLIPPSSGLIVLDDILAEFHSVPHGHTRLDAIWRAIDCSNGELIFFGRPAFGWKQYHFAQFLSAVLIFNVDSSW